MLDWISDRSLALLALFPPLVVSDEEHFMLMRGMFALLFIVLVVGVFAMLQGNRDKRPADIGTDE